MTRQSAVLPNPAAPRAARAAAGSLAALGVLAGGLFVTQSAWGSALALSRIPRHEALVQVTTPAVPEDPAGADRAGARCTVRVLRHRGTTTWGWETCRAVRTDRTWDSAVRVQDGRLTAVPAEALPWDLRALVHHCPSAVVPPAPLAGDRHTPRALATPVRAPRQVREH